MAKIIIIGGGIAGLAAAQTLALKGHRVIILEARSRLGGRIYTTTGADHLTPIELGASFWEGLATNPFYQQFFSQQTIHPHQPSTQQVALHDSLIFFMAENGTIQPPNPKQLVRAHRQAQPHLKGLPYRARGKTCQEYIDKLFPPSLRQNNQQYWQRKWIEHDLRHHCTSLSLRGFGSFQIPTDRRNLEAWNDDEASFCFVKGGYCKVIQQISQACQDLGVNILLNHQVTQVIDQAQQGVEIQTPDEHFKADKVISTIPLGVLKNLGPKIFPELSAAKYQAIKKIGVHEATRIVLEFSYPFWQALQAPYIFLANLSTPGFKEFRINFPLHGKPILQTDSYADSAQNFLVKKNDQKAHQLLISHVMQDLRAIFPAAPAPIFYAIHHWSDDPFAQGAYPYRTILMTEAAQQALEAPQGNIYFAGGDFSRHGFSVHNAYANGKAVAELLT